MIIPLPNVSHYYPFTALSDTEQLPIVGHISKNSSLSQLRYLPMLPENLGMKLDRFWAKTIALLVSLLTPNRRSLHTNLPFLQRSHSKRFPRKLVHHRDLLHGRMQPAVFLLLRLRTGGRPRQVRMSQAIPPLNMSLQTTRSRKLHYRPRGRPPHWKQPTTMQSRHCGAPPDVHLTTPAYAMEYRSSGSLYQRFEIGGNPIRRK